MENFNSSPAGEPPVIIPPPRHRFLPILIIILVLLGGGTASAYFFYYQPLHRPPVEVLALMTSGRSTINSMAVDGKLRLELMTVSATEPSVVSLRYQSLADVQTIDAPRGSFSLDLNAYGLPASLAAILPGGKLNLSLEAKFADQIAYFKFSKLPVLGLFDLSMIENRWIKIDTQGLQDKLSSSTPAILGDRLDFRPPSLARFSAADQAALKEIFNRRQFLTVAEELPAETVDGVLVYHYRFAINKDEVKLWLNEMFDFWAKQSGGESFGNSSSWPLNDKEFAINFITSFRFPEGEIWIGKKDFLPRKVMLNGEWNGPTGNLKYLWEQKQSKFNEPVVVEAPAESTPLEDLLAPLLSGFLFGGLRSGMPSSFQATSTGPTSTLPLVD